MVSKLKSRLIFQAVKGHLYLREWLIKKFGISIPGMGILSRLIDRNYELTVENGKKIFLYHKVSECYGNFLIGLWGERETHLFFDQFVERSEAPLCFVNIGANIGEMMLDMASRPEVSHVYAAEPIPACMYGLQETVRINGFKHVTLIQKGFGRTVGEKQFIIDQRSPTASHFMREGDRGESIIVEQTTLDRALPELSEQVVMLIDVEGSELEVVEGGAAFIRRHNPVIIFEYNDTTQHHFTLDEMRQALGINYTIFKLCGNGLLDSRLEQSWNLVAVPNNSPAKEICAALAVPSGTATS
ncbi:MAG: FkbM family methyltransferase [Magnetococcales bacterium]|nr:FkbM family methyltransferase [Magnetococcales bacterium]